MVEFCLVDGCDREPCNSRGWCRAHYRRWLRYGTPMGSGVAMRGEPLRYFHEVVLSYDGDDCLIWPFSCFNNGYAQMHEGGKAKLVHRRLCEEVNGPPPTPGHEAAHSCGHGMMGCVSKHHLSWKTSAENKADKHIHQTQSRKLTEEQAREILQLRGTIPIGEIARRFGVSYITVRKIHDRKTWKWLSAA